MDDSLEFTVYCIEDYKSAKGLLGRDVIELFDSYGVTKYLRDHYEALHVAGSRYIVEEIDLFINARRAEQDRCLSDHANATQYPQV